MLGYLFAEIIYSWKRTVFRERNCELRETDNVRAYFRVKWRYVVFIILQTFLATRTGLKIGEYPWIFPSFSWGIFGQVTRLDQSHVRKNI